MHASLPLLVLVLFCACAEACPVELVHVRVRLRSAADHAKACLPMTRRRFLFFWAR